MSVRDTSIAAHRKVRDNGTLLSHRQKILNAIEDNRDYSRRELEELTDIRGSSICSTVNQLVKRGLLVEGPQRPCTITGYDIHPVARPSGPAQ